MIFRLFTHTIRRSISDLSAGSKNVIHVYLDKIGQNEVANALAKRIQSELKEAKFNVSLTSVVIKSPQVPYTVMITEQTLDDGVLRLLHFNPCITEEVHVSNLRDKLLLQAGNNNNSI